MRTMKKGDLVVRDDTKPELAFSKFNVPKFEVAIVITEPYLTVFTQDLTHSGVGVFSQEKIVVDLLEGSRLINKCPVDLILKTQSTRRAQGEN